MRLQLDSSSKTKNILHAIQASILALAILLTITIFTRRGTSDGRVGWYFGLCWLTIPILVYLVMVPMWSRARRFSNVYAFAVLDGCSIFLWLTAWASMASYVASGKDAGSDSKKSGCDNFKYGSPGRCKLSTGITILGAMIMLAFLGTSFFSFRAMMTFKRTGMMPVNQSKYQHQPQTSFSQQTQEAFSSNMHTNDFDDDNDGRQKASAYAYQQQLDEEYAPIHQKDRDRDHEHQHEDDLAHLNATQAVSPLNQHGLGLNSYDTSYGGAHGQHSPVISPDGDPRADYGMYGKR